MTDPPFFDNVHYSELADFFYAWQRTLMPMSSAASTRQDAGVQDRDAARFASKLTHVFQECHRVLVDDGLLVFSYHHSRDDGWVAMARAICDAGLRVTQAQPVKAEMSGATPKGQATDPIDLDILLVCRKQASDLRRPRPAMDLLTTAHRAAAAQLARFSARRRRLSRNDVKVLLLSRLLVEVSAGRTADAIIGQFEARLPMPPRLIDMLGELASPTKPQGHGVGQLSLVL